MHYYDLYESPQGQMLLVANGEGLSGVYFDGQKYLPQVEPDWRRDARHAPLRQAKQELSEYFGGGRKRFERSEEHTSELQSLTNIVCRLLLEKKKKQQPKENPSCTLDAT